jgi:primosomal protein N' (replication factor Y) (superfamily II helicase)
VSRVREELEALVGEPVDEVSSLRPSERGSDLGDRRPRTRVVVGTEAVLHQVDEADAVAFLDLDQELLAPRYRAVEQALALLARAARLVGGKDGGGRLLLQTRVPRHEVVQAVLQADPARVAAAEAERRALLRFPPAAALAEVSGPAAGAYIDALRASLLGAPPTLPADGKGSSDGPQDLWSSLAAPEPEPDPRGAAPDPWASPERSRPVTDVEILGPADGRWLVRAPDHETLCDALAEVARPQGRLRLAVDPLRV